MPTAQVIFASCCPTQSSANHRKAFLRLWCVFAQPPCVEVLEQMRVVARLITILGACGEALRYEALHVLPRLVDETSVHSHTAVSASTPYMTERTNVERYCATSTFSGGKNLKDNVPTVSFGVTTLTSYLLQDTT